METQANTAQAGSHLSSKPILALVKKWSPGLTQARTLVIEIWYRYGFCILRDDIY